MDSEYSINIKISQAKNINNCGELIIIYRDCWSIKIVNHCST